MRGFYETYYCYMKFDLILMKIIIKNKMSK